MNSPKRVDIWHNILWSRYKANVFSSIFEINNEFDIHFYQIAETERNRISLGSVDHSYHRYPYRLIFEGAYNDVPLLKRIYALSKEVLASNADLYVFTGYETPQCWAQIFCVKLKRRKCLIFCDSTINDNPQATVKGLLKRIIFSAVDGVLGYGERSKAYALHYGVSEENHYIRRQAAALPFDYTPDKAFSERVESVVPSCTPRFLYVGRLSPEKSLETLIQAFAKVLAKFPRAKLVLVGDGVSRESLATLVTSLGIHESVLFLGRKEGGELYKEYSMATCLVLPSLSEPWGLVVNEALAFGCPVLVSDACGCVPELVVEGRTGLVHEPGNVDDLFKHLMLSPDMFEDTAAIAQSCLEVISDFVPEKTAQQMLNSFHEVLKDV